MICNTPFIKQEPKDIGFDWDIIEGIIGHYKTEL